MTYVLAFYEIDLAYGGPEEGGWYYSTAELVRTWRTEKNEEKAYALARRANRLLSHIQRHQREVSSVLYSGGRYAVHVYENIAPQYEPEHRPHYE